jgi:hypothetical protein
MRKKVNDLVNKTWAKDAHQILTGSAPDITTIYKRLLTITTAEQQNLKSAAARGRFSLALEELNAALKYGWAFGFNREKCCFTPPAKKQPNRRVAALIPLAVKLGETIGQAQAAKINRAHSNAHEKGLALRHTHATEAS